MAEEAPDHHDVGERLAVVLAEHGMQRMTARVIGVFVVSEQQTLTQGEVAEALGAGTGSVSSAIKTLIGTGLVERVPVPGTRREHYRLRDDAWPAMFTRQNEAINALWTAVRAALNETEPGTRARQRLQDMDDFYGFVFTALPELVESWKRRREGGRSDTHADGDADAVSGSESSNGSSEPATAPGKDPTEEAGESGRER